MSEQELEKKTCQEHKNFEIIAVEYSQSEQQVIKSLCVNCLIQMIGNKNILLYDKLIELIKEKRNKCDKEIKEKTQERVNYMNELQQSFSKLDQIMKGAIAELQNNLGQKISESQKEIEQRDQQVDSTNLDENIQTLLSTSGVNDEKQKQTQKQESDIIKDLLFLIKKQLQEIPATQEYQQIIQLIKKIEQSFQIKLEPIKMEAIKTPSLKQICNKHKKEIIMIDLNPNESQNRFACVQCVQESPNNYVGLIEVVERLRKYTDEQCDINKDYNTKRKERFCKANQMLLDLKQKYNQVISEIIQSLDSQFLQDDSLKQNNNYENISLNIQDLEQQEIQNVVDILCQEDQHANLKQKLEKQDQDDSKVYKELEKGLESLMQYDILTIHNLMNTLNNNQLELLNIGDFIQKNQSNTKLDDNYFIKYFQILQEYINIIDKSFEFYLNLQKQVDERNQVDSQSQRFQEEYKKFQFNSTKMKTYIMAEENEKQSKILQEETQQQKSKLQEDSKQIEQLQVQSSQLNDELNQLKQKLKELQDKLTQESLEKENLQIKLKEFENKNQQLQQSVEVYEKKTNVLSETIDKTKKSLEETTSTLKSKESELANYSKNHDELLKELKCVYQFVNIKWESGTNTILRNDYFNFILSQIEKKMNKKIKNQYLIYSGQKHGLNSEAFWKCINKTSNLLMIFKSKSGYIFGGFSPCQWIQIGGAFTEDNTNSSFLFSQTHDQIYSLKEVNKQYAIYCHQSFGPTFGNGHDLQIGQDFQSGYSNLGYHYQWDGYQFTNSTHLFGQLTPNIEQCEIIMLTYA
ncbi:unnamed protein product [Paramecium primaurelia]|uniref:TLDc domain-containing protein n=1 Tax=Paramecium primaurelia TaxID=5886 RepID=A0A8S1PJA4_PARPR|nr:unnamed protein product [Paramecium primaurelia]